MIPHGAATFCNTQNYIQKQSYGPYKHWNIPNAVQHDPEYFSGLYQGETQSLEMAAKRLIAIINCSNE
jgi:hypothetical protein